MGDSDENPENIVIAVCEKGYLSKHRKQSEDNIRKSTTNSDLVNCSQSQLTEAD